MLQPPLITIIIPTFNAGEKIAVCLDSIIIQSHSLLEILVIDGGSSDNTVAIIKAYKQKDSRIAFVSEPDKGIYDAMNKGVQKANGDWLLFLGADDHLYNSCVLQNTFEVEDLNGIDVVYGNVNTVKGIALCQRNIISLMQSNICHQAIFYHKNIIQKYGPYNTKYKIRADNVANIQLFCDPEVKWKFNNVTISFFGIEGISNKMFDFDFLDDIEIIYLSNFTKQISTRKVYEGLRAEAYVLLKYYKFWKGIKILWKSGNFMTLLPNIFYCIKVRLGIKKEC